jgi:hypothetical protein
MNILKMIEESPNVDISVEPLAIGVRVPRSVQSPMEFLSDIKEYTSNDISIKRQIELCEKLYKYEGTIGSAIDMLTEFGVTEVFSEDTKDKELNTIIEFFNSNVNTENTNTLTGIDTVISQMALEFFITGNIFPYATWKYVDIPGVSAPVALPMSITLLNPKSIEVPEEGYAFGQETITYNPGMNVMKALKGDGRKTRQYTNLRKGIPQTMLKQVKGSPVGFGSITLDNRYVTHIKRKGRDYQIWGTPYLVRTFASVSIIKKLRRLDEATTEGLMNLVTIFKIGTDDHPAGLPRLQAFSSLLSDPAASTTLVWAHDIEVEQTGPDGKILNFRDKYKDAYAELLRALGLPIGMYGSEKSVSWEDLLVVAEKLKEFRTVVKKWIEKIYRQIATENNKMELYPKCKMARMNLFDDTAIKNTIMNFWDRGLLDPETALREAGYNFESVVEKKKELKSLIELFLPPALPFSSNDNKLGTKKVVKNSKSENTVNLKNKTKGQLDE